MPASVRRTEIGRPSNSRQWAVQPSPRRLVHMIHGPVEAAEQVEEEFAPAGAGVALAQHLRPHSHARHRAVGSVQDSGEDPAGNIEVRRRRQHGAGRRLCPVDGILRVPRGRSRLPGFLAVLRGRRRDPAL